MTTWTMSDSGRSPAAGVPAGETAAQLVHRRLRDDIVSMRRRPGDVIFEKEIALEAHVSRTPVREALLRLADEKLIEIVPKSGTMVSRIPAEILPEIIVARAALEAVTVRAAAKTRQGIRCRGPPSDHGAPARGARHRRHRRLSRRRRAHAPGHRRGRQAAGTVGDDRSDQGSARSLSPPDPATTAPHGARTRRTRGDLSRAIAGRDDAAAAAAMDRHLDGLRISLAPIRELNPDYFSGDVSAVYDRWAVETA